MLTAAQFPDCDFTQCDGCGTPFAQGATPTLFFLVRKDSSNSMLVAFDDACIAVLDAKDRAAAFSRMLHARDAIGGNRRNRIRPFVPGGEG